MRVSKQTKEDFQKSGDFQILQAAIQQKHHMFTNFPKHHRPLEIVPNCDWNCVIIRKGGNQKFEIWSEKLPLETGERWKREKSNFDFFLAPSV